MPRLVSDFYASEEEESMLVESAEAGEARPARMFRCPILFRK